MMCRFNFCSLTPVGARELDMFCKEMLYSHLCPGTVTWLNQPSDTSHSSILLAHSSTLPLRSLLPPGDYADVIFRGITTNCFPLILLSCAVLVNTIHQTSPISGKRVRNSFIDLECLL